MTTQPQPANAALPVSAEPASTATRKLHLRADARAVVEDAGLAGEWFPCGTGQGFADWLYVYREEVTPDLRRERFEYVASCLSLYESGIGANEAFGQAADVLGRFEKVRLEGSALVAHLRASETGRLAFAALRHLATSRGRTMGPHVQNLKTLKALTSFRTELWVLASHLDKETLRQCFRQFHDCKKRDWRDFTHIERLLKEFPPSRTAPIPRPIGQLIAVCGDPAAGRLIESELVRVSMTARIGVVGSDSSAVASRRRAGI